jgi:hypothetical protein
MKYSSCFVLGVVLAIGCGQSPPPTGPAAEATTPDIEVNIPDDPAAASSNEPQ